MDGYAVLMPDVATAGDEQPVALPVAADVPAGRAQPIRLRRGTAVRVMTGAPVPEGTDAVVPVEWTDARHRHGGDPPGAARRSVRARARGRTSGRRGGAAHGSPARRRATSGCWPRSGRDRVPVHPRPRVVIVSTGSELVPPGGELGYGQIHDSNGYALLAAVTELGA